MRLSSNLRENPVHQIVGQAALGASLRHSWNCWTAEPVQLSSMSSADDDLNKELLQVAGGRAAGGKRGRAAASASEESPSEEVDLQLMCSSSAEVLGTCYSAAA